MHITQNHSNRPYNKESRKRFDNFTANLPPKFTGIPDILESHGKYPLNRCSFISTSLPLLLLLLSRLYDCWRSCVLWTLRHETARLDRRRKRLIQARPDRFPGEISSK